MDQTTSDNNMSTNMDNDKGSGMSYSSLYLASRYYEEMANELSPDEMFEIDNEDVS
jgi:hypothetical protein